MWLRWPIHYTQNSSGLLLTLTRSCRNWSSAFGHCSEVGWNECHPQGKTWCCKGRKTDQNRKWNIFRWVVDIWLIHSPVIILITPSTLGWIISPVAVFLPSVVFSIKFWILPVNNLRQVVVAQSVILMLKYEERRVMIWMVMLTHLLNNTP